MASLCHGLASRVHGKYVDDGPLKRSTFLYFKSYFENKFAAAVVSYLFTSFAQRRNLAAGRQKSTDTVSHGSP
jgi:hypothetical protein